MYRDPFNSSKIPITHIRITFETAYNLKKTEPRETLDKNCPAHQHHIFIAPLGTFPRILRKYTCTPGTNQRISIEASQASGKSGQKTIKAKQQIKKKGFSDKT